MSRITYIPNRIIDSDGIADGANVYVYQSGTTTPISLFLNPECTVATTNPYVVASGAALPPLYYNYVGAVRVRIVSIPGTIQDEDPYTLLDLIVGISVVSRTELAALANPALGDARVLGETGREGIFVFNSANLATRVTADPTQGVYVAPVAAPTGASGAWVRRFSGPHDIRWFGSTYAAFTAIQSYFAAIGQTGYGYNVGVPRVYVPMGVYAFAGNPLDITYPIHWTAEGSGGSGGGSTVLQWNNTSSGIRVQANDTTGDTGTQAPATHRGNETVFDGFMIDGGYANGNEAEFHAVNGRAQSTFRNCMFMNWAGDVFCANADTAGAIKGNANLVTFDKCWSQNTRDGFRFLGGDSNAGSTRDCSAVICRRWGFNDSSFLGNTHHNPHTSSCARTSWNTGAANRPCSFVSQAGNRYYVINGQAVGASTNAPSGTTADNTWWAYFSAGGVDATTGCPAWFNGINVRAGGGYLIDGVSNGSVLINPYQETDQSSQFDQKGLVIGRANLIEAVKVTGGALSRRLNSLTAEFDGTRLGGNVVLQGNLSVQSPNILITYGPQTGTADTDVYFDNSNSYSAFNFRSWLAGVPQTDAYIRAIRGFEMRINGRLGVSLRYNDADRLVVTNLGADVTGALTATGAITGSNLSGTNTGDQTNITGNAGTATALQTSRNFSISGGGITAATVGFNGTAAVVLNASVDAAHITFARMANLAATSLIGNNTGAPATPVAITLAGGLTFSGTTLTAAGALTPTSVAATGAVTSSSATAGIGYAAGSRGTVAQITSKATGVTLNNVVGDITLNAANLAADTTVSFVLTNSALTANDTLVLNHITTGAFGSYVLNAHGFAAGSCTIDVRNITVGALAEAIVIRYAIIKGG